LTWKGQGLNEKGIDNLTGKILVEVNAKYFRPAEVDFLCGDPSKALKDLGWKPKTSLRDLIKIMVDYDLRHEDYGAPDQ
jgi:GDPmannose 4,6-dehydratase